jgi:hypothetical protein
MDVRDTIIQRLLEAGFWASARDWGMGATVIAGSRVVKTPEGLNEIKDNICLVPMPDGKWRIDLLGFAGEICDSVEGVIDRTIEIYRMTPEERDALLKVYQLRT